MKLLPQIVCLTFCITLLIPCYNQKVILVNRSELLNYVTGTMPYARSGADINGDGLDDVTRISSKGIHLSFQKKDGTFEHRFYEKQILVPPYWSICSGNLDNKGSREYLLAGRDKVSFLWANEDSYEEQVMGDPITCQRSTLFDIDNDGLLDALVCRDDGQSQVFRNLGTGQMIRDESLLPTPNSPGNYAAIWTDYNNDGFSDLYVSKCLAGAVPGDAVRTNLLFKNNGNGSFTETAAAAGINDNAQSWTTAFEDFDNDGDFDAFVINHDIGNRLFRNNNGLTFTNVIAGSGIDEMDFGATELATADFNNDGFMDIFSELKKRLYLGNGDLSFTPHDLPVAPGAIGDFNNDGFMDVTLKNELWLNQGNNNHWLKIHLRGVESNGDGIGAKIELHTQGKKQLREVRSGQGYATMSTLTTHFGLGQDSLIDSLIIRWPSGIVSTIRKIMADTTYFIPESYCYLGSQKLRINDDTLLCPGTEIVLPGPQGFRSLFWSNGSDSDTLRITLPGLYHVVYTDSLGCSGISNTLSVKQADHIMPEINIVGTEYPKCFGEDLILQSNAGPFSVWSNGISNAAQITIKESGTYSISTDSVCGTGKISSHPITIEFIEAAIPKLVNINQMNDSTHVLVDCDNCIWYKEESGGIPFHQGNTYALISTTLDTYFYVENVSIFRPLPLMGGKPDTMGFISPVDFNRIMYFSAWKPFQLLTVDVYINTLISAGERTIFLISSTGDTLASKSVYLNIGKNEVELNFRIVPGRYTLTCNRSDQVMNVGIQDYPFPLNGFGQIDSSSVSLNFYPYFYNWKIRPNDIYCHSERLAINITPSYSDEPTDLELTFSPAIPSDNFTIEASLGWQKAIYQVYDSAGRSMANGSSWNDKSLQLDVSTYPSGLYHLRLMIDDRFHHTSFMVCRI